MKQPDSLTIHDALARPESGLSDLKASVNKIQSYDRLLDSALDATLRAHLRVANIRDDQLVLMADSPAWATRARLVLPKILDSIIKTRPEAQLTGVKIITRPGSDRDTPTGRRPNPISAKTRKLLSDVANGIDNPKLRRSLLHLARRKS